MVVILSTLVGMAVGFAGMYFWLRMNDGYHLKVCKMNEWSKEAAQLRKQIETMNPDDWKAGPC